jgi:trimethylamine--corrinoid protein Co-methyltransferase
MDMATGISSYGAPELSLMMSAYADVIHSYGIPVYGTAGCSDSKLPDEQAAIEATFSILCGALSGANLIHDVGVVDIGMTVSLEAFVMCNEIIAMTKRIVGGMPVTPETLAFDVIERVGPGGHFLDDVHTLRHFREHLHSKLIDRQRYDRWTAGGALSMRERLRAKVRQILHEHKPDPLPEDIQGELARIVRHAQERAARS